MKQTNRPHDTKRNELRGNALRLDAWMDQVKQGIELKGGWRLESTGTCCMCYGIDDGRALNQTMSKAHTQTPEEELRARA